jgi:hypothetical protein
MQLRRARLCLDCEEIHDAQQCPVCASESFAFLTRWVPAPERRSRPRPVQSAPAAARLPTTGKVVGFGIVGLGLLGLARWWARGRQLIEDAAMKNPGELK